MLEKFQKIARRLFCPDDGSPLEHEEDRLACRSCGRHFPILSGHVIELLPREPSALPENAASPEYVESYFSEFKRPFQWDKTARAWGAAETVPRKWARRRLRQVREGLPLLLNGQLAQNLVLCDISAGASDYTLEYSRHFEFVLHCDLSVDSLNYASLKAEAMGVTNIAFLRVDYFHLPFRRSIDRIICFDTLIRREPHERLVLRQIRDSLAPGGRALIDFHSWWHNPLRRIGLLSQNFRQNRSYTRREAESLLREAGITKYEFFPFHQEFDSKSLASGVLKRLIPPTRLMFRFSATDEGG